MARSAPPPRTGGSSTLNRTVEGAVPTRRAISRVGIPADFNLITSRTWRIANLSVGIQVPLRKAERRDRIGARIGLVTPGDIIPEWWARSSRNGGRHQIGTVGEIIPESWAISSGISSLSVLPGALGPIGVVKSYDRRAPRLDSDSRISKYCGRGAGAQRHA